MRVCIVFVKTFKQYSDKMVKFYKKSVSFSALWVSTNDKLSDFYTSSWQRSESPAPMLVMRAFLTACALAILTWSLVEGATAYWLIYLTNWGILLVMATTMTGLAVSFIFVSKRPCESTELPWYVSLYWVLFNIGVTMSVMITALYWILLYNPDVQPEKTRLFWLDVTTHGLTSCVVMAELVFSRTPVRLPHIYQPLGLGLWYAVFTGIYYLAGGTDIKGNHFIYEVLDWQQSTRTGIVVIGSVAGLIVLYLTLWGVAFIRDKISSALVRTRSHDLPTIPSQQNSHMV